MSNILHSLQYSIANFGVMGVFLVSIIEEIIVPIPSTLVQSGAGAILLGGQSVGFLSISKLIFWIAIPASLGVAIGSLLIYALAYYGGMIAIKKYGRYFFLSYEKVENARKKIVSEPSTIRIITVLRFLPIFPNSIITAASGILRIPLKKYLLSTILGIFIRVLYLASIGWFTSNLYTKEFHSISTFGILISLIGVLILVSSVTSLIISYTNFVKKKIN